MVRFALVILAAAILGVGSAQAAGIGNMTNHGGPILESPSVYAIFWLPPGRHIEPSGDDSQIEARVQDLVDHLSGTHYLGVVKQYGATNQIHFGGSWVDSTAYPHAATQDDPLQVTDYGDAVKRAMVANGWQPGLDKLYLVYTADDTEACGLSMIPSGGRDPAHSYTPNDCTFPASDGDQCAGHSFFTQSGQPVAYAAIPFPAAGQCQLPPDRTGDPNNDVPLDTELLNTANFIAAMIIDPLGTSWYTGNPETGELACFAGEEFISDLQIDGKPVPVFSLWSNAKMNCAFGYPDLPAKLAVKVRSLRRHRAQTVTVKTAAGATVRLRIAYANGRVMRSQGTAVQGVFRYRWNVPKAKGRVHLVASVSTPDGGSGTGRGSFVIR